MQRRHPLSCRALSPEPGVAPIVQRSLLVMEVSPYANQQTKVGITTKKRAQMSVGAR
jgi:hypothetical protein